MSMGVTLQNAAFCQHLLYCFVDRQCGIVPISGILRHLVSGDNGFEDRAEIDIPDRAIPTDEVVVHVVFALTDTIGGLEIGQGILLSQDQQLPLRFFASSFSSEFIKLDCFFHGLFHTQSFEIKISETFQSIRIFLIR